MMPGPWDLKELLGAGHERGERSTNPFLLNCVLEKLPLPLQQRWCQQTDRERRNPSSPSSMELVAAIADHISATARRCAEMLKAQENPPIKGKGTMEQLRETRSVFTNGMIFEFTDMDQAKGFAVAVKKRFALAGRVFDDAEAAARVHMFPWVQNPPVVHIDRPYWQLPDGASDKAFSEAWATESQIFEMAGDFGGKFVGT